MHFIEGAVTGLVVGAGLALAFYSQEIALASRVKAAIKRGVTAAHDEVDKIIAEIKYVL